MPRIRIKKLPKAEWGLPIEGMQAVQNVVNQDIERQDQIAGRMADQPFYNPFDVKWGQQQYPQIDITGASSNTGYDPYATSTTNSMTASKGSLNLPGLVNPNLLSPDSGPGIAPETQQQFKKPSFGQQLKGLGMSALKGIDKAGEAVNSVIQNPWFQAGAFGVNLLENRKRKKDFEKSMRERSFNQVVDTSKDRGWTNVNTGMQGETSMTPPNVGMFANYYGKASVQFGGEFFGKEPGQKVKIKVLSTPDESIMKYGGQSGHALDMGWRKSFTNMNTTSSDHYKNSMSEVNDGSSKAIEVEGGETMYKPGDQTLHTFHGPRHSEGGIELTEKQISSSSKPGSTAFVYSDTPKLKIKDPEVLAHFGVKYKRGGVTPAEISKKFDLNKYKAILEDIHSDKTSKDTAKKMIDKNETYLAELAAHQEKTLKKKEVPDFAKQKLSGKAKYGGLYKFPEGGEPPKTGGPGPNSILGDYSDDFDTFKTLLTSDKNADLRKEIYNRYKTKNPSAAVSQDDFINNLIEAQRHIYAINNAHQKDPDFLKTEDWDWGNKARYDNKGKLIHKAGLQNSKYIAEATKLGMSPLTGANIKMFQEAYRNLEDASQDPAYKQSFGNYFDLKPIGVADDVYAGKPISGADEIFGNTTVGQFARLKDWKEPEENKPKWLCVDGKAVQSTTGAGYDTEAEALKNCEEKPKEQGKPKYICVDGKVIPSNSSAGYDSPEEAAKYCDKPGKGVPHDYLLPDKTNMLSRAMVPPRAIYPYVPDKQFTPGQLNLEDWRAQAANAFSTQYAAPAQTLAQYTGPQGLASNLSSLAGQAAMNITGNIIPTVTSRNVDRANQFGQQEQARRDAFEDYNNQAKLQRYTGYATTLQNYDNALRGYLKTNQDAFERAWKNRMHLADINDVTAPDYYKDPNSGFNVYRNNNPYGVAGLPSGSSSSGDDLSGAYNGYYNQAYETVKNNPNIPKEKWAETANQLAMANVRASKTSESYDPYTGKSKRRRYDFDFGDNDDPRYPG